MSNRYRVLPLSRQSRKFGGETVAITKAPCSFSYIAIITLTITYYALLHSNVSPMRTGTKTILFIFVYPEPDTVTDKGKQRNVC